MPPPPPPELSDDLLGEAFLRLPPDDPACLLRASLACKRWRRILADPAFRRRHRELHRTPSVVGFLGFSGDYASRFVPNNPASGRPASRDLPGRFVLDCRHGRVLLGAPSPLLGSKLNYDLIVWDPLTNEQRCLPPALAPTHGHIRRLLQRRGALLRRCGRLRPQHMPRWPLPRGLRRDSRRTFVCSCVLLGDGQLE
ncbi:unnamed protein product [Miscanthus lutarioriparius]|uniref:F-box domain-containing protein n=1 Tax=Miscanthus lutarioriparius TaxID=422564 RepID=A0A811RSP3_9POAL|nr:unnamed protein product [Miscanthus lutarioriparius]